ncbi:MAG: c-type cytochrome [Gemmatimonadota bacterium]
MNREFGRTSMWRTNLNIGLTVAGTLAVYTAVANMIPQVQSEVPEAVSISGDVTPEELVRIGGELFRGAGGCTACHGLGTRAPDLLREVGTRCASRKPGMSCKEYLYESLVDPAAYVVEGFQPIMPPMGRTLSESQIWALVAFLESQGGEVTVTADDIPAKAAGVDGSGGTAAGGGTILEASLSPRELIHTLGCLACHELEGEGGKVGPPFSSLAGKDREYLRRGILRPNADTAQGFEAFAGTMPPNFGDRLTAAQLEALVDFLRGAK